MRKEDQIGRPTSDPSSAVKPTPIKQPRPKWHWVLLVAIVLLIIVVLVKRSDRQDNQIKPFGQQDSEAVKAGRLLSNNNCTGTGPGQLTKPAMNESDFTHIIPYGLMVGGHVTPIDHQYYSPASMQSPRDAYPVYAVGDATLVYIEHRTNNPGDNQYLIENETNEYRLIFSQSCTFLYYYDLVTSLEPAIAEEFAKASRGRNTAPVSIPVVAGQQIGRIGGQTLDFAVWDTEKPLSGFARPEHYASEPWKIYTADPLNYMSEELKSLMLARSPRTTEPISGKIDWDIKGKLRGTWFREGKDFSPENQNIQNFWESDLSFSPDLYDHSRFIISIGNFGSRGERNSQSAQQFYAKGNIPDPADVTVASGLVKYELVDGEYMTGNTVWNRTSLARNITIREASFGAFGSAIGTVLVQMLDDERIKFEVFRDKSPNQVEGFDGQAIIYTR